MFNSEVGRWVGESSWEGASKPSSHSTLCKTKGVALVHSEEHRGGRGRGADGDWAEGMTATAGPASLGASPGAQVVVSALALWPAPKSVE